MKSDDAQMRHLLVLFLFSLCLETKTSWLQVWTTTQQLHKNALPVLERLWLEKIMERKVKTVLRHLLSTFIQNRGQSFNSTGADDPPLPKKSQTRKNSLKWKFPAYPFHPTLRESSKHCEKSEHCEHCDSELSLHASLTENHCTTWNFFHTNEIHVRKSKFRSQLMFVSRDVPVRDVERNLHDDIVFQDLTKKKNWRRWLTFCKHWVSPRE